jgi:putative peptide zinc metalloprotease protein
LKELENLSWLDHALSIDTSEDTPVYMVHGRNRTQIRLSPAAYQLLHGRSQGLSFEELAQTMSLQLKKDLSPRDVKTIYHHLLEQVAEIERNPKRKRSGFLFRLPFLPKGLVKRIASYLSVGFGPVAALCLLPGVIASVGYVLAQGATIDRTLPGFWWVFVLFLFSMLIHELGHASACVRYGAEPNEIGFTIYMIWPAFYNDVSNAWQLRRWQRVVVDLGGIYFQLVVAGGYAVAYILTNWEPLKMVVLIIVGSFLFSLNPIFKFDGYWMVADALGITNLDQQRWRILRHLLSRFIGRSVKPLPWPSKTVATLATYTFLSLGVWGYFMWKVFPTLWAQVAGYPAMIAGLISDVLNPPHVPDAQKLKAFLPSTLIVAIAFLLFWKLVKRVAYSLMKWPRAIKLFAAR